MITRTHFVHRIIHLWDSTGDHIIEHLAGIEDFALALATYRAACQRWPGGNITLRAGARVIEDNPRLRAVCGIGSPIMPWGHWEWVVTASSGGHEMAHQG